VPITLFTIGFAGKTAERFFTLLEEEGVRTLADIRLRPNGQLGGYARHPDIAFLLSRIVPGCAYRALPELAPTAEILDAFRRDKDWDAYVAAFEALMDERGVPAMLDPAAFDRACLLCSEPAPDRCHRRLVAERLQAAWPDVEVRHL